MGPDPAVAAVRRAVRDSLAGLSGPDGPAPPLALVACSGGADSLALAAALAFEAPRRGVRAGAVTIDHGLQPGSAGRAAELARALAAMGLDPVRAIGVHVPSRAECSDEPGQVYPGPEAAARYERYAALEKAAGELAAAATMLGHTMDDQAETVLLGLARGSGARSLAGMAPVAGGWLRPLLGLRRSQTRQACRALGLEPWDDPHNDSPAYARVRVRQRILPVLEAELGPGVAEALARTAALLRADADLLDQMAGDPATSDGLDVGELAAMPAAIRTRLLRAAAIAAGSPPGALGAGHVTAMEALVTSWHGQRWTDLPGGIRCQRRYGKLLFTRRE